MKLLVILKNLAIIGLILSSNFFEARNLQQTSPEMNQYSPFMKMFTDPGTFDKLGSIFGGLSSVVPFLGPIASLFSLASMFLPDSPQDEAVLNEIKAIGEKIDNLSKDMQNGFNMIKDEIVMTNIKTRIAVHLEKIRNVNEQFQKYSKLQLENLIYLMNNKNQPNAEKEKELGYEKEDFMDSVKNNNLKDSLNSVMKILAGNDIFQDNEHFWQFYYNYSIGNYPTIKNTAFLIDNIIVQGLTAYKTFEKLRRGREFTDYDDLLKTALQKSEEVMKNAQLYCRGNMLNWFEKKLSSFVTSTGIHDVLNSLKEHLDIAYPFTQFTLLAWGKDQNPSKSPNLFKFEVGNLKIYLDVFQEIAGNLAQRYLDAKKLIENGTPQSCDELSRDLERKDSMPFIFVCNRGSYDAYVLSNLRTNQNYFISKGFGNLQTDVYIR